MTGCDSQRLLGACPHGVRHDGGRLAPDLYRSGFLSQTTSERQESTA
ncbi:hypothetical protein [uncultured Porphyromonas sp.]|nr:hypothetical protein [uncultured Porphyromonas sp.]